MNVVCRFTDKVAYLVNAMGTSKAMMKKVNGRRKCIDKSIKIFCTHYGNLMYSYVSYIFLGIGRIRAGD